MRREHPNTLPRVGRIVLAAAAVTLIAWLARAQSPTPSSGGREMTPGALTVTCESCDAGLPALVATPEQ